MDGGEPTRISDKYGDFAALAHGEQAGIDYCIKLLERAPSKVSILAPHGGSIERRTSAIATAIAEDNFNLYLFEGTDPAGSFEVLHITSHRFDEPQCLNLISRCDTVVAIHGCSGDDRTVMLGGLDQPLIADLKAAIQPTGVQVLSGNHRYPGTHKQNICNRGRSGRGVQIELTDALRGSAQEGEVVTAIRSVLQDECFR